MAIKQDEEFKGMASQIIEKFKNEWITGRDYTFAGLEEFKEKSPDSILKKYPYLPFCLLYVTHLAHVAMYDHEKADQENLDISDIVQWNDEGGLCMFASTLLYALLTTAHPTMTNEMARDFKFVQGFFYFKLPKLSIYRTFLGKDFVLGLHSFLLIDGCVVDPSIQQVEEYYTDEPGEKYLLGDFKQTPIQYFGFRETSSVVIKYAEKIAEKQGKDMNDWLKDHYKQAVRWAEYQKNNLLS